MILNDLTDEESSEHSSGVRQSARINFDDDLVSSEKRYQSKNSFLANTIERLEERFVEGHDGKSEGQHHMLLPKLFICQNILLFFF